MRNPTYAEDFQSEPRPEKVAALSTMESDRPTPVLSMGIKTMTHNRDGLRLYPHKVIAIEMQDGDELMSFDLTPRLARMYAERLVEFSDKIEGEKK